MKEKHLSSVLAACCVVVLLCASGFTAWSLVGGRDLYARRDDLALSVETSQKREKKQSYEHEQYLAELPEVQAALEAQLPLTAAAQAEEEELRAARKAIRAEIAALEEQIAALKVGSAEGGAAQ